MTSSLQERADAANDSYVNRSQSDLRIPKKVQLDGKWYQVFGYANAPVTGFHGTAYKSMAVPHEVIIAYRGTDPGLFSGRTFAEKKDHAPTTLQDIAVDATMVRDTVNPQKAAADRFTAEMIAKAAQQGISKDRIAAAGHSLGGTLAEIEAAKYGLTGSTFNAYGAVGLADGPPQPGCRLTNYRMAGDVVSAANPHIGTVVPLASQEDVQSLRDGRYLDAPVGEPPPNALIAMRLGDHGVGHFHNGPDNVLAPHRFQEAAQRYADNKAAFDRFSGDVSREHGELSLALRRMQAPESHVHLPPDIQRQVDEYLALHADQPLRHAIEQSSLVRGAEQGLHFGAEVAHEGGQFVQAQDERVAKAAREAGMYAIPLSPAMPLAGFGVGEAAHLHGEAVDAAARFVGDQLQSARGAVEQDAHMVADAAVRRIHDPDVQAGAVNLVNRAIDDYHRRIQAGGQPIEQAHGIGRLAGAPAGSDYARADPRHPENPDHALYKELQRRIPEASENRLLQFTAACHVHKITGENLREVHFIEKNHSVVFASGGLMPNITAVEVGQPSPQPAQSIQQIQNFDAGQALLNQQVQQQLRQIDMQAQQGPVMGGR